MENVNNENIELTEEQLAEEKKKILDKVKNPDKYKDEEEDIVLPSEQEEEQEDEEKEPRLYANNFKTVDELKKGIYNLKSELPQYIIDGMNEDALEKHYIELRKEFSSRGQKKAEEPTKSPDAKISEELWSSLEANYAQTGSITAEQRAELNKAGFSDKIIDGYIAGVEAQKRNAEIELQTFTEKMYNLAGGKEEYEVIKSWAEENYTQEQLDSIASGSYDEILLKMEGVKARYLRENGEVRADRIRGSLGSQSGSGYKNQAEYLADVMDRRYKTDSRYRAKVKEKFSKSNFSS